MKAYSARNVPKTNGTSPAWPERNFLDRTISLEDFMALDMTQAPQHAEPQAADSTETDQKFHLDTQPQLVAWWAERELWRRQALDAKKKMEALDALIADAMGKRTVIYLRGREVASYDWNGTFRKNEFLSKYPDVAEECTQYERVFSLDLLKTKYPDIYAKCRARTMLIKDRPVVPE